MTVQKVTIDLRTLNTLLMSAHAVAKLAVEDCIKQTIEQVGSERSERSERGLFDSGLFDSMFSGLPMPVSSPTPEQVPQSLAEQFGQGLPVSPDANQRPLQNASDGTHVSDGEAVATVADKTAQARRLIERALQSYGSVAIGLAEQARDLVGMSGLDGMAVDMANSNAVGLAWRFRGALDALTGQSSAGGFAGVNRGDYDAGLQHVNSGGFGGHWRS